MSAKSITDLNLNSITLSNSNYANIEGYTPKENILTTNNAGVLLVNNIPISSGGGGDVNTITAGTGIDITDGEYYKSSFTLEVF